MGLKGSAINARDMSQIGCKTRERGRWCKSIVAALQYTIVRTRCRNSSSISANVLTCCMASPLDLEGRVAPMHALISSDKRPERQVSTAYRGDSPLLLRPVSDKTSKFFARGIRWRTCNNSGEGRVGLRVVKSKMTPSILRLTAFFP